MKLKQKTAAFTAFLLSLAGTVIAHSGEETGSSMMMDGAWMHNAGHMTGYNMWGMGWFGSLLGIAFWVLVILGIIYLFQQVTGNREEVSE